MADNIEEVIKQLNSTLQYNLKHARTKRRASQRNTAFSIGANYLRFSRYETGKSTINAVELYLLAQHFNMNMYDFFSTEDTLYPRSSDEVTQQLLAHWHAIRNTDFKERILEVIEAFVSLENKAYHEKGEEDGS